MYQVAKRQDGWHVIDLDGYDVSYVSYDTKKEALESARIFTQEQNEMIAVEMTDKARRRS